MKTLHRLAIVLGVAEIALIAAAARRHAPRHHGRGCATGDRATHDRATHDRAIDESWDGGSHGRSRPGPAGPPRRGGGGPPPWMRERLADWHRAQHGTDGPEPNGPDADAVDTVAPTDRPDDA